MAFDLDHEAVNVVFNASVPVVLTDDVRFKFYSSNVCHLSLFNQSLSQPLPLRKLYQMVQKSVSFISGSIPPLL